MLLVKAKNFVRLAAVVVLITSISVFSAGCGIFGGDDYPSSDIEWYVGFSAGGGFDTASRIIAEEMSTDLGTNVVVRKLAGGGGRRAAQEIHKAPADGYAISCLLYTSPSPRD